MDEIPSKVSAHLGEGVDQKVVVMTITAVTDQSPGPEMRIQQAALIALAERGFGEVTAADVCRAAGVTETEFAEHYANVGEIYTSCIQTKIARHRDRMTSTFERRRSLTESLRIALMAFLDTMREMQQMHIATKQLTVMGLSAVGPLAEAVTEMHQQSLLALQSDLLQLERVHSITWELPVERLALLMMATLEGLITDYLLRHDDESTTAVLEVLAYHLAQHGRRSSKNQPK